MGGLYPASSKDRLFFTIFLLGGHLYLYYERFIVLPHYHTSSSLPVLLHTLIAAWTYLNIIANIFIMRFSNYGGEPVIRRELRRATWTWCPCCEDHFPPRSHHCKLCDECVLRRDHHCWFAGCCVAATNHRYFIAALSYIWFAAVYGNIINFRFVCDVMGGPSLGAFLCVLFPHVAMVTGYLSAFQLFVSVMTLIAYVVMILTTWLMKIQFDQIHDGQTKYERKKKIDVYNRGVWNNVHDVLGPRWYLIWLWPWIQSQPTDDGMNYMTESSKSR